MPDLIVSMPAHNAGRHIRQSIQSVLGQEGVDLQLVVVDDGSTDDTAELVASCGDPRVHLLRNDRRMGARYCHDLALRSTRSTRSTFVMHVDADGILVPGALRKMVDALESDPGCGEAHCYFFELDSTLWVSRERFHQRWQQSIHGRNGVSALHAFPRAVLEELQQSAVAAGAATDHGAPELPARYSTRLVPEFLYARVARETTPPEGVVKSATLLQRAGRFWKWKISFPATMVLYRFAGTYLSWWPLGIFSVPSSPRDPGSRRVAYYHYAFPILSETFLQREVTALRYAGLAVETIAHEPRDVPHLDADAKQLMETTHYVNSTRKSLRAQYRRYFFLRRPLTCLSLFIYVVAKRHSPRKSLKDDLDLYHRALCLARVAKAQHVTHLHSPWAGPSAFVAHLAARLIRVPHSMQARATDLHRDASVHGLRETLRPATFIITNARFNQGVIRSYLPAAAADKVKVIYEGLYPERFQPSRRQPRTGAQVRLLTVARLTAPKGLEHLLHACALLKNTGCAVKCEIVGGYSSHDVNYTFQVLRLRRALGLEREVAFLFAQPFDRVMMKYQEADIFVLPSQIVEDGRGDVSPNVLFEAMAMKLPVVSTHVRGIPEIVEDGVSGLLVPPRDPEALAQAIRRLIDDPTLREALGEQGRRIAEERFDIRTNVKELVALFQGRGDGRG